MRIDIGAMYMTLQYAAQRHDVNIIHIAKPDIYKPVKGEYHFIDITEFELESIINSLTCLKKEIELYNINRYKK